MNNRIFSALWLVLLVLMMKQVDGQDLSNKGRDFWITFPAHVDGNQAVMGIYITSDKAATGKVEFGGNVINFSIAANGVRSVFLGPTGEGPNTAIYQSLLEGIVANSAVHVTANTPVVVYAHIIRSARSGASLILPTTVWGRDYIVPSYRSAGASGVNSGYGIINVVAKEPNTVVEITPTATSRTGLPAGVPYTITLSQPGDVYQVQYQQNADISGTVVKSIASGGSACKPIAVFSATTWSAFDCIGASGGDNLFQQLFPTRSFGRRFLTAPFFQKQYDIFRVFVIDPSTVVTRTSNGVTSTLTGLVANRYYEFTSATPNEIEADKPVSVVHYMTSQSCGNTIQSDPEMVLLNPVEQTINNITVFSAHQAWVPPGQSNVNRCFLNIIIKTVAAPSFRINGGLPLVIFNPIPGTEFSYVQADVTALSLANPIQTLTADSSFSAIAYGYGNVESYGYNAGTNVRDLFQYISIKNENATVNFPATCINAPFNFSITLPYQPTQLNWQFYGKFSDVSNANPTPDSSFVVEGKTLYQYRLPGTYVYDKVGVYKVTVLATNPSSDGCAGEQQIDYDVEVFNKPTANFDWKHTGCTTDSVKLNSTSNGLGRAIIKYKWTLGDNTIDSVKSPSKKYAAAGQYTIKHSIITDIGCLADTTKVIDITNPPNAKFGISAPLCVGSNVTFSDSSIAINGTLVKWYWDFGNGRKDTVSNSGSRTVQYSTAGSFNVSLVVETNTGCKSVAFTKTITISPFPVASFVLPGGICLPAGTASFVNTSTVSDGTQAQLGYVWNFGDGKTSTSKDPVHAYTGAGPFTIKLVATSLAGCVKDTSQVLSTVYLQPKANFNLPAELCLRDTAKFTDASTASGQLISKYFWDFGDNTSDTLINPSKRYNNAASYTVKHWIRSDKGCFSDTVSKVIVVNPLPTAAFNNSAIACEKNDIVFTDVSQANAGSLNRWQWNLGDGTTRDVTNGSAFNHSYATAGNKEVTLIVTSTKGCIADTLLKTLVVNVLPKPGFDLPEVCLNDAFALFTNTTSISDGTIGQTTYLWNFGDPNANAGNPNISSATNGQHKYSAAGLYNVKLVSTSKAGCKDSTTQQLTVNGDKPKADFVVQNALNLCGNAPVTISNQSTVNFGAVTKTEVFWEWPNANIKTTDDEPAFGKTYTHLYPNFQTPVTKTFQIRFLAYSGGVCVSEVIKTVTVNASPKIVFATIPGICFDASPRSITQATDIAALSGAGTYSGMGVDAAGLFSPAVAGVGTHTIQYIFKSAAGCSDTAVQSITVWPRPIASFTVDNPTCVNQAVVLRDASVANFSQIGTWAWNFGDGNTDLRNNGIAFSHTYASVSNPSIQLQVTTDSGCVSVPVTKSIRINPLPVVNFDLPVVCLPAGLASFTDRTTIADGSQAQFAYQWNFGVPGANSTLRNPRYNYASVGAYSVKLVVTSKDGCRDSLTKVLTDVNPQPLANFAISPATVCIGDPFAFTDQSNPLGQSITGWNWNFGDGNSAVSQNSNHLYSRAGSYNVALYYRTSKGCVSDTAVKTVVVNPFPVVNAGPDLVVLAGGQVTIAATATGSSNYQYSWSPATYLNSATVLQPVSKPLADISYTLTVTGAGGCTKKDDVFVKLLLAPEIPNVFSPNNDGVNDVWSIRYLNSYPGATVQVFDRYGKVVYNSVGYNTPWDGTFQGQALPAGVYYYVINPKNGRKTITGSVTIVR